MLEQLVACHIHVVTVVSLFPSSQVNYEDLTGPWVQMIFYDVVDGGIWLSPIRGDVLRQVYQVPQVGYRLMMSFSFGGSFLLSMSQ